MFKYFIHAQPDHPHSHSALVKLRPVCAGTKSNYWMGCLTTVRLLQSIRFIRCCQDKNAYKINHPTWLWSHPLCQSLSQEYRLTARHTHWTSVHHTLTLLLNSTATDCYNSAFADKTLHFRIPEMNWHLQKKCCQNPVLAATVLPFYWNWGVYSLKEHEESYI